MLKDDIQNRYSNFGWNLWHYVVSECAYKAYNNVS